MSIAAAEPSTRKPDSAWRLIWRLLLYQPGLFVLNAAVWACVHTMPIATGLISQRIFDRLTGEAPLTPGIPALLALLTGLSLIRAAVMLGGVFIWATYYYTMIALLRRNMLYAVLHGAGHRTVPASAGEAISRFRDDVTDVSNYVETWVDLWGMALYSLVAIVLMFRINAPIAMLVFIPLLPAMILPNVFAGRIRRYRQASREATGRVTSFIGETFGALLAVRLGGAEQPVTEQFAKLSEERRRTALRDRLLDQLLRSFNSNMVNFGTGVMLIFGATAMQDKTFTVGDFALFISYYGRLTDMVSFLGGVMTEHRRSGVSLHRMGELLPGEGAAGVVRHRPVYMRGREPELPVAELAPGDYLRQLEIKGLTYHYPEGGQGIADVDLVIERGSFTVITGRIGAGKSTLLKVLLGLVPAESGSIYWNGVQVTEPDKFFMPPHTAYTPQAPRLFSESLRDNIIMGAPFTADHLDGALHNAVLEQDVADMEKGLDTVVGPRGVRLSGGQVQRAASARMFIRHPELLVFDDLSSALDVETEQQVWDRMFAQEGITCLTVSHRKNALQRADQVVVMENGKVVAVGKLSELLETNEYLRQVWSGEVPA